MLRKSARAQNRGLRRRLARYRRRALRTLAAALIAGGTFAAAQAANAQAAIGWDPGIGPATYTAAQLGAGVDIDIDGDGNDDLNLWDPYGGEILLTPLTVNLINNEVFTDGSQIAVMDFADPAEVLAALANGDTTVVAPGNAVLWSDGSLTAFQNPGAIAGLLFERPGGSPYVAYLDIAVVVDFGLDYLYIAESGYQLIPEPGTALLGAGGLLGLGLLGRRRAQGKRAS